LWPGSSGVERGPEKAGVGGSIPSLATTSRQSTYDQIEQFEITLKSRTASKPRPKQNHARNSSETRNRRMETCNQHRLKPRSISFPKRPVDERLVPLRTAGRFGDLKKTIDNVLFESDGYADLAFRFRLRGHNPASLAFAEIVSVFHRSASYCSRSWASAGRAEMMRMFSPRQVYTA
jgi:hypothetical protein